MSKKYLYSALVLVIGVILLTGCGSKKEKSNTVRCTLSYGNQAQVMIGEYDDNEIITNVTGEIIYENVEQAQNDLDRVKIIHGDSAILSGKKIILNDLKGQPIYTETIGKTKDEFKKYINSMAPTELDIKCE